MGLKLNHRLIILTHTSIISNTEHYQIITNCETIIKRPSSIQKIQKSQMNVIRYKGSVQYLFFVRYVRAFN